LASLALFINASSPRAFAAAAVITQVDKIAAPLADDGAGNPVFLLRQGSQYLVELTVMHAKGQQLPDQTAIESLMLEAPDKTKQSLQLGPTCRCAFAEPAFVVMIRRMLEG
jgi:hypothetical protein